MPPDMGFDLFLLDDGWFGKKHPRNSDNAGLGDWTINREKLPDGLGYLVKEVSEEKYQVRYLVRTRDGKSQKQNSMKNTPIG